MRWLKVTVFLILAFFNAYLYFYDANDLAGPTAIFLFIMAVLP